MRRICTQCGVVLSQYNPGKLCFPCQEKQLGLDITDDEDNIDAEEFARILGLKNEGSVRRKALKGELPSRIPGVRKCQWPRSVVKEWIKQGGIGSKESRMTARGIASNLRRCSNDSVIYALSDTVGSKVYGQEHILATAEAGRVEPIMLVKVDSDVALKMLKQLPKEDFPELIGITDWKDMPYDRINENLLVRLEAYF